MPGSGSKGKISTVEGKISSIAKPAIDVDVIESAAFEAVGVQVDQQAVNFLRLDLCGGQHQQYG